MPAGVKAEADAEPEAGTVAGVVVDVVVVLGAAAAVAAVVVAAVTAEEAAEEEEEEEVVVEGVAAEGARSRCCTRWRISDASVTRAVCAGLVEPG